MEYWLSGDVSLPIANKTAAESPEVSTLGQAVIR